MVFKDVPAFQLGVLKLNFSGTNPGQLPNFVPFRTILPYIFGDKGVIISGINLIGNIILLVPVGLLTPFVSQRITWPKAPNSAVEEDLADPCGGTGGTGQITTIGKNSITIVSKAGKSQEIGVSAQTQIKNANGLIAAADLHVGQHVTIVIFDNEAASAVMVCK